ncbi:DNA-binding protein, partial [Blautia wexlerae]
IIGNLNKELEEQGYLTLRGKVPTKYFVKRFYGVEDTCEIPQEEGKAFFKR